MTSDLFTLIPVYFYISSNLSELLNTSLANFLDASSSACILINNLMLPCWSILRSLFISRIYSCTSGLYNMFSV
nr:MAG TPA: hypothetical protein [Caudoviricetes sp.]